MLDSISFNHRAATDDEIERWNVAMTTYIKDVLGPLYNDLIPVAEVCNSRLFIQLHHTHW